MSRQKHLGHRVIALMDRLGAAPLIRNYHLFYSCLANSDPLFRKAMKDLGRFPSQGDLDRVIDEFCPEAANSLSINRHENYILKTLDQLVAYLKAEGIEISTFTDTVERVTTTLSQPREVEKLSADILAKIARVLKDGASRRVEANRELLHKIESNRTEIDGLRRELINLRKIANTDALTGLANRRAFDETLAAALGRGDFVLILADLDHFKRINDAYGHAFGDHVLKATAINLRRSIGESAFLARTGGEEFAVILPGVSEDEARVTSERLRAAVENNPIKKQADLIAITISVGITRSTIASASTDIYEAADAALYISKNEGRNRVSVYRPTDFSTGNRYKLYDGREGRE